MNLGSILLGFVGVVLIAAMIVFAASSQSLQVVDDNGNTTGAIGNSTNEFVGNVTAVGGTTTGFLVMVIAVLGLISGIGMLIVYGKTH